MTGKNGTAGENLQGIRENVWVLPDGFADQ